MPDPRPADRPGRDRTVAALVAAATDLFGARGPDAVSLREVAAHAGVNYGLIHQYVGTKDDLLRLVIAHVTGQAAQRFAGAGDVGEALDELLGPIGQRRAYPRMVAWALLQGRDAGELAGPAPAMPSVIARLPEPPSDDLVDDQRVRVAALAALAMGWGLYGEFLRHTAGLDDEDVDAVHAAVRALARGLVPHDDRQPGPPTR